MESLNNSNFFLSTNETQGHWFIFTKQMRESLGLMLFPASRLGARPRADADEGKRKQMAGGGGGREAMYKIPKINTIFIIDMLQNKVPQRL